ncbi:hypothetical protein [Lysobacter sp. Root604]|uniref:hypothetical protein n=1 Tax=Lysobacter sp. Root604 TaxID=1736568 RepID=UPI0006FB5AEE|nr:hypothetical protein [Lysobacter sp. Root604]KRA20799.1 hypothetical protein ASD69_05705 [Lysobacter sp. Root604]
MPLLYNLCVGLFIAVIASDWLLARKVRKAVESQRLSYPDLGNVRFGGSPVGIVLNLFRMRKVPTAHDLSDPDHIAIRRHYRIHQILIVLLATCIVTGFFRRIMP